MLAFTCLAMPARAERCSLLSQALRVSYGEVIVKAFDEELDRLQEMPFRELYCAELEENIRRKRERGAPLSLQSIEWHAVKFERFRVETFRRAGVVPKRYFGFFDGAGDTALYEAMLKDTVIHGVDLTNRFASSQGLPTRVSEKEVAITFLAEGGALLLTEPEDTPNRVHPVRGIGLDDLRRGMTAYPDLVTAFDAALHTRFSALYQQVGNRALLRRPMTFREAVLGTCLMYLYEKELTRRALIRRDETRLEALSSERQFIYASLFYNSGILFADERVRQIEQFQTASYLEEISRTSKRSPLPLHWEDARFPIQRTGWSAVFHVLQRYGTWVGLSQYSEVFEGDRFKDRP